MEWVVHIFYGNVGCTSEHSQKIKIRLKTGSYWKAIHKRKWCHEINVVDLIGFNFDTQNDGKT